MAKGFTSKPIFDLLAAVARVKPETSLEVSVNGKVDILT